MPIRKRTPVDYIFQAEDSYSTVSFFFSDDPVYLKKIVSSRITLILFKDAVPFWSDRVWLSNGNA